MTSQTPLKGTELIACARANAKLGLITATENCGYADKTELFQQELQQACQEIGVEVESLGDLITDQQKIKDRGGIEIAPETISDL